MSKTSFENLEIYKLSEKLSDRIWRLGSRWDHLDKTTVGSQVIRSADSIGANLAEGLGRGTKKETQRFTKISRGSLFETKHWLRRAV